MTRCYFCQYKTEPVFKDVSVLEKFLTPRYKILAREKSGICANHQRKLSKHIKFARYLALIPYTSYQSE